MYDYVIVGSGIAGLSTALLAAEHGRVLVVTKAALEESNTRYAQGGIAAAVGPRAPSRPPLTTGRTGDDGGTRSWPRSAATEVRGGAGSCSLP